MAWIWRKSIHSKRSAHTTHSVSQPASQREEAKKRAFSICFTWPQKFNLRHNIRKRNISLELENLCISHAILCVVLFSHHFACLSVGRQHYCCLELIWVYYLTFYTRCRPNQMRWTEKADKCLANRRISKYLWTLWTMKNVPKNVLNEKKQQQQHLMGIDVPEHCAQQSALRSSTL